MFYIDRYDFKSNKSLVIAWLQWKDQNEEYDTNTFYTSNSLQPILIKRWNRFFKGKFYKIFNFFYSHLPLFYVHTIREYNIILDITTTDSCTG